MIRRPLFMLAALILGLPSPVFTQKPAADNSRRPLQTAVRAARLLDVKSGTLLNNAVVLIEGERISAVGSGLPIPAGAKVIDLGDVTLLPGLIDCHTHLLASDTDDYGKMLLTKSQAYRALEGASNARRTLLAGFTSVRDVESEGAGYADVALRDAVNRGLVEGPRMKVATRAIAAVGGYQPRGISPDLPDFPRGAQMVSGVEEARRAVREQIGNGADLIKVYADWNYPTLTVDEMRVVVEEAHKAGRRVAAHATTNEGIRNALEAGVDSIEHGFSMDEETLHIMAARGVAWAPTAGAMEQMLRETEALLQRGASPEVTDERLKAAREVMAPRQRRAVANLEQMVPRAVELGVPVLTSTDNAGTVADDVMRFVRYGVAPVDALRAATTSARQFLGLPGLNEGAPADVVTYGEDPREDASVLHRPMAIVRRGQRIA